MIIERQEEEIREWYVVFSPTCLSPFWRRVVPGCFKHVSLFAYVPECHVWYLRDVSLRGERAIIIPSDDAAPVRVQQWIGSGSVLKMRSRARLSHWPRFGSWCVPNTRHLLGLSGGAVLTPDQLWQEMIRKGAELIIDHGQQQQQRNDGYRGSAIS